MVLPRAWYRDFLDDLRQLLESGFPILGALEALGREKAGRRADLAQALRTRVEGGATLAEAMACLPRTVPEEHVSVVRAGECSGTLDRVLRRLVERLDRRRELASGLIARAAYPAGIAVAAAVLLPLYLIVLGEVWTYASIQIAFFGSVALVGVLAWKGSLLHRLPWLGGLLEELALGRALALLGLLLESGLALGEALRLAAAPVRLEGLKSGLLAVEPRLRAGRSLTEALRELPFLARRAAWLARVAVGEEAGAMGRSLLELGDSIEAGVWKKLTGATRVIPFVLIPLVGAWVLYQALSVLSNVGRGL
ncbi:MAG: type II secretion system F family protein [Planctomycetes bacterium]|nr:type II secretion system F family protein [Planctomycetota bacterium]